MKNYTVELRGTKKNNTKDISVTVLANSKPMAFNMAYHFFQEGLTNTYFGQAPKLTVIEDYIPEILTKNLYSLAGKYKVHHTSVRISK